MDKINWNGCLFPGLIHWHRAQIGVSYEMQYDDAFTLQKVEDDLVAILNYMAGMVPVIQKLITDVSGIFFFPHQKRNRNSKRYSK